MEIIECSPNFSDGRRPAVLAAIVDAVRAGGVTVLAAEADAEQNRSVVRFVGEPEAVEQAACAAAGVAAVLIDMTVHQGAYPRIGATDVVPLAPVAGIGMDGCVARARRLAERLARELDLPVYVYGEAALRPERTDLAEIRAGEYEGLRDRIAVDPGRAPDFGPKRIGPAGAVAVGARPVRIDVTLRIDGGSAPAEAVATALAYASGGLRDVEAWCPAGGTAAEATVLVRLANPERTPLHRVLELARGEAARHGGRVRTASLGGPVPESAITCAAAWYLGLDEAPTIEAEILHGGAGLAADEDESVGRFLDALARPERTPGGTAAAAHTAAMAAALSGMVAALTLSQSKGGPSDGPLRRLRQQTAEQRAALLDVARMERAAFDAVSGALAMPHATSAEVDARRDAIQRAVADATEVPLSLLRQSVAVLRSALAAAENGTASALGDAGVAAQLALASARSGALGVAIHVTGLRDLEEGDRCRRASSELMREATEVADAVDRAVRARIQV